jgi:hypothetical protein
MTACGLIFWMLLNWGMKFRRKRAVSMACPKVQLAKQIMAAVKMMRFIILFLLYSNINITTPAFGHPF